MPSVSIVGELIRVHDFKEHNVFCKYEFVHDDMGKQYWAVVEGKSKGQTQLDIAAEDGEGTWAHPIDIVYSCSSLRGWPKLRLEIWHQDQYQRAEIAAYGFCHVPTMPGSHEIDCVCWRPEGTTYERLASFFVGGIMRLKDKRTVSSYDDRMTMRTNYGGKVRVRLDILINNFESKGVAFEGPH